MELRTMIKEVNEILLDSLKVFSDEVAKLFEANKAGIRDNVV